MSEPSPLLPRHDGINPFEGVLDPAEYVQKLLNVHSQKLAPDQVKDHVKDYYLPEDNRQFISDVQRLYAEEIERLSKPDSYWANVVKRVGKE